MDNCTTPLILFLLEPKNVIATAAVNSQYNKDRLIEPVNEYGQKEKMLKVQLLDQKQGLRGLISFGRHPQCGIRIEDRSVGLEHCCINVNASSGELTLHQLSTASFTLIDGEHVQNPPMRALVSAHAKKLTIGSAILQIHWPEERQERLPEIREARKARAHHLLADPDVYNMSAIQWDMFTAPVTQPLSRLRTARSSPLREPFTGPGPIEIEELGEGAFSNVFLAVDRVNADFVAVKRVKKRRLKPGMVEREIDMLCKLDHVSEEVTTQLTVAH